MSVKFWTANMTAINLVLGLITTSLISEEYLSQKVINVYYSKFTFITINSYGIRIDKVELRLKFACYIIDIQLNNKYMKKIIIRYIHQ